MTDFEQNSVDGESTSDELMVLKEKVTKLIEEREIAEKDFSQKRAVFKELFVQKESELKESQLLIKNLHQQIKDITNELNDLRSATALSEDGRQMEFDNLKNKYEEEIKSLRHIMKQGMSEDVDSLKQDMEDARLKWEAERKSLLAQITDLKQDKESVLSQVATNLRKQIKKEFASSPFSGFVPGTSPASNDGHPNSELEEEMQKAKQDADFLRTIVVPYEEEIQSLKKKIRQAYEHIDKLEGKTGGQKLPASVSIVTENCSNDAESAEEIASLLASERHVAEQYRNRFQQCMDKLHFLKQLHSKYSDKLAPVLSTSDKQELDAILEMTEELDPALLKLDSTFSESPLHHRKVRCILGLSESPGKNWTDSLKKAWSGDQLNHLGPDYRRSGANSVDSAGLRGHFDSDTHSLQEFGSKPSDDESFERRARAGARSYVIGEGKRVVSEREWSRLQLQLEAAQKRVGGVCEMCSNYEDQLQSVQASQQETEKKLRNVQNQLSMSEETVSSLRSSKEELEGQLKISASGQRDRIEQLTQLLSNSEDSLKQLSSLLANQRDAFTKELSELKKERDRVAEEVTQLHQSYKSLLDKRQKRAAAMRDENINLPDSREDLELLALKLREEIITTKSAAEHKEEKLKSQIAFLKDQVRAEQAERASLEESMQRDIADLQEQVARLASCESEYEREKRFRETAEQKLSAAEDKLSLFQALESENKDLKLRVQSLQVELENSESVQKDFVQLSQTLQIQLERLRLEECEVRWQHDEDVSHCPGCKSVFGMGRKRYHCRHCGKVFCADCLGKTVLSGPNKRPSRVCEVCHTMLVKEAVPYFSKPNASKS